MDTNERYGKFNLISLKNNNCLKNNNFYYINEY